MKHIDFFSTKWLLASGLSTLLVIASGSVFAGAAGNTIAMHINAKPPIHRQVTKQNKLENINLAQINQTEGALTLGYKGKPPFNRTASQQKTLEKVQFARFEESGIALNTKVLDSGHKLKGSRPPFGRY